MKAAYAGDQNHLPSSGSATTTILKAPLTIRANDASMVQGSALPALTATYVGLVNGETPAVLDVPVALTTTATPASPPGTYPIVAAGATDANYSIAFVNGLLTITPLAAATPRQQKQAVRAKLAGMLGAARGKTADRLREAIEDIDRSLRSNL